MGMSCWVGSHTDAARGEIACSVIHQCPAVSPVSAQQCRSSVLPISAIHQ
ncbi:unnamed protein product [Staurois parvus]|uniref:Uncharacterized protein n=1 Tax=Staurois parvus TaxID=386267 RepID=A0ABN9GQC0_9NEOB|nr:unnamed protein product [Staurois parvus]